MFLPHLAEGTIKPQGKRQFGGWPTQESCARFSFCESVWASVHMCIPGPEELFMWVEASISPDLLSSIGDCRCVGVFYLCPKIADASKIFSHFENVDNPYQIQKQHPL